PFDTNKGWQAIAKNQIIPQDPRYAFVPLYRRDGDPSLTPAVQAAGNAQIFVIVCCLRNVTDPRQEQVYRPSSGFGQDVDLPVATSGTPIENPNNLYPRQIHIASLTNNYQNTGVDIVQLDPTTNPNVGNSNENFPEALAEGAFIVMRRPI